MGWKVVDLSPACVSHRWTDPRLRTSYGKRVVILQEMSRRRIISPPNPYEILQNRPKSQIESHWIRPFFQDLTPALPPAKWNHLPTCPFQERCAPSDGEGSRTVARHGARPTAATAGAAGGQEAAAWEITWRRRWVSWGIGGHSMLIHMGIYLGVQLGLIVNKNGLYIP